MGDPTIPAWKAELESRIETFRSVAPAVAKHADSTLAPRDERRTDAAKRALELLEQLQVGARLVVEDELLGSGGMSDVHLGTQTALDRKVAVKAPKGNAEDIDAGEVLREAWITGQLEHPHVMPVYDLTLDANGMPLIVLKKVDGLPWRKLLGDAAEVKRRFGPDDVLTWHLGILMQACNAVHFAHSRHIIHRDIKPANVMVGEFGEVYVTDWGIAVSIRPGGVTTYNPEVLAGTPVYLAPEMVLGEPVTERTDVYLLGATLFEILTGSPPHVAPTLREIATKAISDEPIRIKGDVPEDLAAICRTAMHRDPSERYESAEALRRALQRFLERRDSRELATAAESDLRKLQAGIQTALEDPEAHHGEVFDLFGACRFGFKAALRAWPDNHEAEVGLEAAVRAMIELELARLNARGAENLLADLANPSLELRVRVDQALAERAAARDEIRALSAFRRDLDPAIGRAGRFRAAVLMGAVLVLAPFLQHLFSDPLEGTYREVLGRPALYLVVLISLATWRHKELFVNRYNRSLLMGAGMLFASEIVFAAGHAMIGLDPVLASIQHFASGAFGVGMLAVFVDRRLMVPTPFYVAAYFVASARPEWRYFVSAGCNVALTITILWMWWPVSVSATRSQSSD